MVADELNPIPVGYRNAGVLSPMIVMTV
jgi:hypothetical protein